MPLTTVMDATAAGPNDTPAAPADPLIGWWDYGSAITLAAGETFSVDFGASLFTIV